jgi:hypothetical protein
MSSLAVMLGCMLFQEIPLTEDPFVDTEPMAAPQRFVVGVVDQELEGVRPI